MITAAAVLRDLADDCIRCGRMLGLPSEIETGLEYAKLAKSESVKFTDLEEPRPPPPDKSNMMFDSPREAAAKPRRPRRPTLARAIAEARKAGVALARVEINGVVFVLGEPEPTADPVNPWLVDLEEMKKNGAN